MGALKFRGGYVGADPTFPDTIYYDREQAGAWEDVTFLSQSDGTVTAELKAAKRVVSVNPYGDLEARASGSAGLWEKFTPIAPGWLVSWNDVALQAEGLSQAPAWPSKLHLSGTQLRNAEGRDVFLKGATAFMAYEAWLEDDWNRLDPAVNELRAYSANCLRVFGMAHYIPANEYGTRSFDPANYGNRYYDELPTFLTWLKSKGFYCYWATFPDCGIIMPDHGEQEAHHARLVPILEQAQNVLYELTNEASAHDFNYVDPRRFTRPTGMLACSGGYSDAAPEYAQGKVIEPVWDFGSIHVSRDKKPGVLDCCAYDNPYFKAGYGIMNGEPIRYGSNSSNPELGPDHAKHAASAARAGSMGWVFHSRNGVRLEPFDAQTTPFAEAVFRGAYGDI